MKLTPGHFELLEIIGEGAYGRVIKVQEKTKKQILAMKVITKRKVLKHDDTEYIAQERNIMTTLENPFIISLKCSFQTVTRLYLVMEYASGGELFEHLREESIFDENVAAFYVGEIALALEYLHNENVVHRDLKPENVLLDDKGHIKLTDFGLAKVFREEEFTKTLCGTELYMAPEMIIGQGYGKSVDFWALGCLLYEMLTGDPPFYAKETERMYKLIQTKEPKYPVWLSKCSTDVTKGLLNREIRKRLGCAPSTMFKIGGMKEFKEHDFFKKYEICFYALGRKEIESPHGAASAKRIKVTGNVSQQEKKEIEKTKQLKRRQLSEERKVGNEKPDEVSEKKAQKFFHESFRKFSFVQDCFLRELTEISHKDSQKDQGRETKEEIVSQLETLSIS